MAALFASGAVVDLILALVAAEALLLVLLKRRFGLGPGTGAILANLGAGVALLLALRAALDGSDWTRVAAWLIVGLGTHLADLALRFREGGRLLGRGRPPARAGTQSGTLRSRAVENR